MSFTLLGVGLRQELYPRGEQRSLRTSECSSYCFKLQLLPSSESFPECCEGYLLDAGSGEHIKDRESFL